MVPTEVMLLGKLFYTFVIWHTSDYNLPASV